MNGELSPGYEFAGKYRVERVIGRGGMGVVVAARRLHLDDVVAVKFLLAEQCKRPDMLERFLREGRAAVKIKSERVARVFDVDSLPDGAPYIVMELLEGEDLQTRIRKGGALSVRAAADLVLQACEALAEAHTLGMIHRDLKPANLFLVRGPDGEDAVKVLDFGISKLRSEGMEAALTAAHELMGSPAYMAPEQIASASDVDGRSDIWSLGIILYQALVGRRPYDAKTLPALVMQIVNSPVPDGSEHGRRLPRELAPVIQRCLEKEPKNRYRDVGDLGRALGPLAGESGLRSLGRIQRTLDAAPLTVIGPASPAATVAGLAFGDDPTRHAPAGLAKEDSEPSPVGGSSPKTSSSKSRSTIDSRSSLTLISTLKGHHLTLKLTAKQIGVALSGGDAAQAKTLMKRLRETLATHIALEDARLYPELRVLAERSGDADMVALVDEFAAGMADIGEVLSGFFQRHGEVGDLAEAGAEWSDVLDALAARMQAEETSLYPLHKELSLLQK
jgi:serine/threonine protein kinase